ncbi:MAG: signal peptide peptidase SppA [Desulfobacterales bacterium]|jgi:protease-4|nr:signal peptide peptidase SppA [Desulfobacterales bacterium]
MFSRRHPFLFFVLIFSSILAIVIIGTPLLFILGSRDTNFDFGEKVGIIEIKGVISDSKDIIEHLKQFREDGSIKSIVLRIDSPGGSVGPSQEIFREVRKTIDQKKVITSMGTIAASGGYYVAAGTDGIVANPGTITGSIGVIMGFTNLEELIKKIGLVPIVVKSGKYKDTGSPVRQMTEDEEKILQNFVQRIHMQFVKAIAEGRKMDVGKVKSIADGRIFSGEEAKDLGLVDRLGNLDDAIEWAGRLGGIKGKIASVYAPEKKYSVLRYIIDLSLNTLLNRTIHRDFYGGYLFRP